MSAWVKLCVISVIIIVIAESQASSSLLSHVSGFGGSIEGRQDTSSTAANKTENVNCTPHSLDDFPNDLFTAEQRRKGAAIIHALFGFYCFLLTAFVCNDYLLPALDCICADMRISADVAGATFLATASCFPELFVNVVGTFLTESDLGVGTVMGGAVFNTFATPACGALYAVHGIQLEWRILSRDCVIYVISVGTLVIVMWDGLITLVESVVLIVLFAGYLALLFSSKVLSRWFDRVSRLWTNESTLSEPKDPKYESESMPDGLYKPYFHGDLMVEYRKSVTKAQANNKNNSNNNNNNNNSTKGTVNTVQLENGKSEPEEYVEPDTPFVWHKDIGTLSKIWFVFTWPLNLVLFITIPDTRYRRFRNFYPITFIMCVIWIAISSYLVSWMMTTVGDTLGIADSIMGITFLSAGGNMPELVSIVILSRQGNGDMAMSNTLGANTLDILLCLGFPWAIKTIMSGKDVQIVSGALSYSVLSIVVCVIGFYGVTAFYNFKLNKKVGAVCLLMYAIFLAFAIAIESNVFFHVNWPMCPK